MGADVVIFDYIVRRYSPKKLKEEIDRFGPDVVGTNSVTMNFKAAANILKTVKQHNPSIITMMGGPHVSFDAKNTLLDYPEIDVIVVGEAEQTLKELLPVIREKTAWEPVRGIAYSDNGQFIQTGSREFIEDLDAIPLPARHLLPMSRYLALGYPISIITSRGCPGRCIFCQGRQMVGRKVRYRTPALIVDEIEQLLAYGNTRINIADDFFTSNKKRVHLLCQEIKKRGIEFNWSAFARVDSVDKTCLQAMKNAGCDTVSFGIESGNPEMLKRIRKGITLDKATRAVKCCKEVGMDVFVSFIIGLPGESQETLRDTHKFANELDIPHGYHFLAPFPGTVIREEKEQYDIDILTDDWDLYDANRAIVQTSHLKPEEIENFLSEYNKKCKEVTKEIEERYISGNGSETDIMRYEGSRRMGLVFRLLSEDIIENHGLFELEGIEKSPISKLSGKVSQLVDMELSFVKTTLDSLLNSGYIKYKQKVSRIEWFWTHNNKREALGFSRAHAGVQNGL